MNTHETDQVQEVKDEILVEFPRKYGARTHHVLLQDIHAVLRVENTKGHLDIDVVIPAKTKITIVTHVPVSHKIVFTVDVIQYAILPKQGNNMTYEVCKKDLYQAQEQKPWQPKLFSEQQN